MRLLAIALLFPFALGAQVVRNVLECPPDIPEGFECVPTLIITESGEEPPNPGPGPGPGPGPEPGPGVHGHFDAMCTDDRAIACRSFRVADEIGCEAPDPSMWHLDEQADAMRLTLSRAAWEASDWVNPPHRDGGMSLDGPRQCRTRHETVTEADRYYSYQIEIWLSASYTRSFALSLDEPWNETLKLITVPNGRANKELELNVHFSGSDDPVDGHSGRPTHRIYKSLSQILEEYVETTTLRFSQAGPSNRGDRDRQPSIRTSAFDRERPFVAQDWRDMAAGDTEKPALFPTGEWCRYTVHIEYHDGQVRILGEDYTAFRMSAFLACESYDTVQFLSSVEYPGEGMIMIDDVPVENHFGGVYIEHNSSGPGRFADTGLESVSYWRNLIVWKGGLIPPGGRPNQ